MPLFVLGFLGMALLNTFGVFPKQVVATFDQGAKALILVALVGVGLSTDFGQMRKVGLKPLYLGLITATLLSGLVLLLIGPLSLG